MTEQESTGKKEDNDGLNILTPIFLVLSLVMVCLLFASSILIGSYTKNNIETPPSSVIVAGSEGEEATPIQIAGVVSYPDGTPIPNHKIQLHSVVQETVTDEKGWFLFEHASPVRHELIAVDDQGNPIASVILDLRLENEGNSFKVKDMEDGRVNVALSSDVFYIEMNIKLDTGSGTLTVNPDLCYGASHEGSVYTADGVLDVSRGIIILPSGTVINQQSEVIHYPVVVQSDNTVVRIPEEGMILPDGTIITKEEVTLPDGTSVKSGGEVIKSDEQQPGQEDTAGGASSGNMSGIGGTDGTGIPTSGQEGGNPPSSDGQNGSGAIQLPGETNADNGFTNDNVTIIDGDDKNDPNHSSSGGSSGGNSGGSSGNNGGNHGGDNSGSDDNGGNGSGDDGGNDNPTQPESQAPLTISGENRDGQWNAWVENQQIDLFYHQNETTEGGEIPVIRPGSSGWYSFDVQNTNHRSVTMFIRMTEDTIHLPLRFRLLQISESGENVITDWTTPMTRGHSVMLLDGQQIGADTTSHYRIEWVWPYETGIPGDDENDTAVASRESVAERTYLLNMGIYTEDN